MTVGAKGSVPDPPESAVRYFGDALETAAAYAGLLAGAGTDRGLIGPREVPRLWERHLLNCAVVQEAVPEAADVVDVGSGAGLPGLVLAIARADLTVTLVEPLLRRTVFLNEVVAELGLTNVRVVRGRAEDLADSLDADVVTARAVAPIVKLARWCLPLVRPGGVVLAMKGSTVEEELADGRRELSALGVEVAEVRSCGEGVVDPPTRLAVLRALQAGRGRKRSSR